MGLYSNIVGLESNWGDFSMARKVAHGISLWWWISEPSIYKLGKKVPEIKMHLIILWKCEEKNFLKFYFLIAYFMIV